MKKNMGTSDKLIRTAIAVLIFVLYMTNVIVGDFAVLLVAIAFIFALTSYIEFCPIYWIFGISTCKHKNKEEAAAE
ncbi:MAG: DUF2892 domain-containing protein [Saprospiraceae bacterium]|nr:DUF2892 domain-containing protein [Saprospiraceae bacterium]